MTSDSAQAAEAIAYFDESRSAEVVNNRMGGEGNDRLKEVMAILVRHLHAAVKEAQLAGDEWMQAIRFLTETGQMCSDWRQEFILLSDVLGVSMLVDSINNRRPGGSTENTVLGPFYLPGAPRYEAGANICLDGKGEPTLVRGQVRNASGEPIPGATIEVWQTNDDGFYDVQQPGVQPDFNLRGTFTSGSDGGYSLRTVRPRYYPIPFDGPVGKLLRAMGRHPNRAAHLHFIVDAPGYERVVTHIFTPDCPYLAEDAVFGVKQSLIADFKRVDGGAGAQWEVDWDFVLVPIEQN